MPAVYVCPLSRLGETVERSGASHVVTMINDGTPVARPPAVAEDDHLFLGFNDISTPVEGMTLPAQDHLDTYLEFLHRWDRARPLVVHCWAGVSRSTAGAFTATLNISSSFFTIASWREKSASGWSCRCNANRSTPTR